MSYEQGSSLDSLVAFVGDSLGSPTGRSSRGGETNVRWENRTTRLRLRSTGTELFAYLGDPRRDSAIPGGR